jgi:DNA-binding XRE family transcriptional regulator
LGPTAAQDLIRYRSTSTPMYLSVVRERMAEKTSGPAGRGSPAREQRIQHLSADERLVIVRFGQRIRALRTHRNAEELSAGLPKLTIDALAKRAGINATVLGEIERGRVNPSLMVITRLARALDVTLPALLAET